MKRFLKKVLLFIFCITALVSAFLVFFFTQISPQYTENYQASIIDKVARLESLESPKIILVGNSNLVYGINSELIQEEMGMPVVNLGLHGGLGNMFHEDMAKLNIGEGDIVVVCHTEYADGNSLGNPELTWLTIENHRNLWKIIRPDDVGSLLTGLPSYVLKASYYWVTGEADHTVINYNQRVMFNEFGDNIYPREERVFEFGPDVVKVPEINDNFIARINEFYAYCKEKNADLVIAGYPIADGEYTPSKEEYETFGEELEQQLDCEVISDFTDYMFPYDMFFNTYLHLTIEGAEMRSEQLVEDLKQYLEK